MQVDEIWQEAEDDERGSNNHSLYTPIELDPESIIVELKQALEGLAATWNHCPKDDESLQESIFEERYVYRTTGAKYGMALDLMFYDRPQDDSPPASALTTIVKNGLAMLTRMSKMIGISLKKASSVDFITDGIYAPKTLARLKAIITLSESFLKELNERMSCHSSHFHEKSMI